MIMNLSYGRHAQAGIPESILYVVGLSATRLDAQQANDGAEAVLDPVAHLSCQQRLVLKRLLKPDVCLLAFDRNP